MANSLYADEKKRKEKEAEFAAEGSEDSKDLNNLIVNDGESESAADDDVVAVNKSIKSTSYGSPAKSMNADLKMSPPQGVRSTSKGRAYPKDQAPPGEGGPEVGSMQYVEATLNAWNNCPLIVKKQLDDQAQHIKLLTQELRAANLRLNQRKADFERHSAVEAKVELMKHKDKVETMYRQKMEDEKLKATKKKVEEMDAIFQENFVLKKEMKEMK